MGSEKRIDEESRKDRRVRCLLEMKMTAREQKEMKETDDGDAVG